MILPLIVFMTHALPSLLTYGKRLFAEKIGLQEPLDRMPAERPTAFGLSEVRRLLADLQTVELQLPRAHAPHATG